MGSEIGFVGRNALQSRTGLDDFLVEFRKQEIADCHESPWEWDEERFIVT